MLAEIIGKKVYGDCHLSRGKPDPSIFEDVLVDLQPAPGEVLFVDDQDAILGRQILER